MKIVTGSQMADIDKHTIEEIGIPGSVLMENAARAFCRTFVEHSSLTPDSEVMILCGSGNNGGDGLCIARILAGWGYKVHPLLVGRVQSLKSDALLNFNILKKTGPEPIIIQEEPDLNIIPSVLSGCEWVVDALFGTGLTRPIVGIGAKVLKLINEGKTRVAAVDIPSGINSDNGQILGDAAEAELTVTFGLPKWGHFLFPGAGYRGKLVVADIGFPVSMLGDESIKGNLTELDFVNRILPRRQLNAHKGSCGNLAVIAGCRHYLGAAVLTGKSALKMGTGYITLFLPNFLEPVVKGLVPEIVSNGLPDMEGGFITTQASSIALRHVNTKDALAIGPGLSIVPTTRDFIIDVLEDVTVPSVVDADGLNALSGLDNFRRNTEIPWVMTPHPGEAARLLNVPNEKVLDDVRGAAEALAEKFKAVIVLKGAHTLIVNPDGKTFVNPTGNPGMAVMGMGDTLTGIIASLLARKIPAFEAAVAGTYIHGLAGDIACSEKGEDGLTPTDLTEKIPEAVKLVKSGSAREKFFTCR
ncbi:MAG: NAD(P)H-hydrate dehydratase [Firmicutes bacterium]|nr:NAD(P)H-hydrate dehydratase [Bacillota bacterium]